MGADLWNADDADGYDKARIIFCGGYDGRGFMGSGFMERG
jgi:hypothetical protein